MIFGLLGMIFKAFYLNNDEAYIQSKAFPLTESVTADFETKRDAKYQIAIALVPSEELKKARAFTISGDAYESSAHLGRYVLNGTKIKLVGLTKEDAKLDSRFHIFGPHPPVISNHHWDPHASYSLATFEARAGSKYRLTVFQETGASEPDRPRVPGYVIVDLAEHWTTSITMPVIMGLGFLISLIASFSSGISSELTALRRK